MFKLYKNLKPYTLQVITVFILVFLQSMSELYLPTLMSGIVDTGIIKGDTGYILKTGGIMLFIALGGTACTIYASFLSSRTSMGFGKILRGKVFSHVENFTLNAFDKLGTPSLITRTTNDITQVQMVTMMLLRMTISAPIMCIGGVVMAVSKDATLALVVIGAVPVLAALIFIVMQKSLPLFKSIQTKIDRINLILRENLTGIRVIRAFNRTEKEKKRFDIANLDLTDTSIRVNKIMAFMMPMVMLLMNFTVIAIIWFGGIRIDGGHMQVGSLMAFIQYVMQIMFSLMMMSMMFIMVPRASASAERINEVLEVIREIHDPEKPLESHSQRGFVEFKDVTFRYPGAEQPALSNITFCTGPGEVTAIIGGTGAGKSTLINLIPRFYDVNSGSVLVDGLDVREMTQEGLRAKIGFIPQKAVLFAGTIKDNIRFGKEDANIHEITKAADTAQAMEFISSMEEGFDFELAQEGTNLSGGQKQRLSIARALVRKPEIYIFDDSFSALDFKTDTRLRAALKKETARSTVIIVAQRVNTVMDADRIIVLDEGKIAGMGTHKELLETCAVYREIVLSQLSEEEIA